MISYIIQGVLITIFGPTVAFVMVLWEIDLDASNHPRQKILKYIKEITISVYRINVFVSLSVLIASVIRIAQVSPLAEVSFVYVLVMLQYFIVAGSVFSILVIKKFEWRGEWTSLTYAGITYVLWMVSLFQRAVLTSKATLLETLNDYCVTERDYPILDVNFDEPDSKFQLIFWLSYAGGIIVLLAGAFLIKRYFSDQATRLWKSIKHAFVVVCGWLHVRPKRLLGAQAQCCC